MFKFNIFFLTFLFFLAQSLVNKTFAASAIEALSNPSVEIEAPTLVTETIQKISPTQKIFIITNNNNSYFSGDYVSIVFKNSLVARAIVAKQQDSISGIKILHIDSTPLWKLMRPGLEVQILRGDDSYFKRKTLSEVLAQTSIESEEDLYKETNLLEDDLSFDENKDRAIKTDNIVTANVGFVAGVKRVDDKIEAASYMQPYFSWAYQLGDNIWGEFSYGANNIDNFPWSGLGTRLSNITVKLKYSIATPFYSYIFPYFGYQKTSSYSPSGGKGDISTEQATIEKNLLNELNKDNFIFGATLLKRLVPGWFFRIDVGTDILGGGFGLEF